MEKGALLPMFKIARYSAIFPLCLLYPLYPFPPPPPFFTHNLPMVCPHNVKQSWGFWVRDDKFSEGDTGWSHTALDVASDAAGQ